MALIVNIEILVGKFSHMAIKKYKEYSVCVAKARAKMLTICGILITKIFLNDLFLRIFIEILPRFNFLYRHSFFFFISPVAPPEISKKSYFSTFPLLRVLPEFGLGIGAHVGKNFLCTIIIPSRKDKLSPKARRRARKI